MSGPIKAIGKVIKGVGKAVGSVIEGAASVVKKAWPVIVLAAAAYFTSGFGMAAAGTGAAGTGMTAAGAATAAGAPAMAGTGAAAAYGSTVAFPLGTTGTVASGGIGQITGAVTSGIHPATGVDPAIKAIGAQVTSPTTTGSQIAQVADQAIVQSEVSGAGAQAAQQSMAAAKAGGSHALQASVDEMISTNPGLFGSAGKGGFMSGVNSIFSKVGGFIEEHPYAAMMGFQTLTNLTEPSLEEQHEIANRWPGAFYGMEHDGRTVEGKGQVKRFAPGTEPNKLLNQARNAATASGQSPTINPVRNVAGIERRVEPRITQLNPNPRRMS